MTIKKQVFNPYLPSYEYIPDAEPYVFGDRVYIYGSHDLFNAPTFCMGDYVCYSADVNDLSSFRFEGVIYKREQDPSAVGSRLLNGLAAPDVQVGPDGRYYLYYFMGGTGKISVAVCDEPAGSYEFYGDVHYADGVPIGKKGEPFQFDPAIFMDDDGRLYLYTGFALTDNPLLLRGQKPTLKGPMCFELDPSDMCTVVKGPVYLGAGPDDHLFLEASSLRKYDGKYYFIYSSKQSHELCYAVSDKPDRDFTFGGILVSNGDIGLPGITDVRHARNDTGNTHGSILKLKDRYFIFYHRQTNRKQSSRQACAEEIRFENGRFIQAEMTSCGMNGEPLMGEGYYSTYICCNLYGKSGTRFLSMLKRPRGNVPYLTQDGRDRESGSPQYIANFCDGSVAGFKYFNTVNTKRVSVRMKGHGKGQVFIKTSEEGEPVAKIEICSCREERDFMTDISGLSSHEALYFTYKGTGRFRFTGFTLYE
ncbi:MAG: family 43 glycosylhydrolase [Lachnospiraceae bacterium]|nr:family 43 glycosylhydrolase [Lachnospiraceae bacterium]